MYVCICESRDCYVCMSVYVRVVIVMYVCLYMLESWLLCMYVCICESRDCYVCMYM